MKRRHDISKQVYTAQEVMAFHQKVAVATTGANRAEKSIMRYRNWEIQDIQIEDLNYMEETVQSPRSQELVLAYRQKETSIPPIIITPSDFAYLPPFKPFEIADGFHRVAAALSKGLKTIQALVPIGDPL